MHPSDESKTERYVLGSGKAPEWCRKKVVPYRRMDGSIGYEFAGKEIMFELRAGDVLIYNNGRIDVKKKRVVKNECKKFFETNQKD